MIPVSYVEKGYGLHLAVANAGYRLWQEGGQWLADDAAVQAIIDAYDAREAALSVKLNDLKAFRTARAEGGITWNGWPVYTDRASRSDLDGGILKAQMGAPPKGWKFADGEYRTLSQEEFVTMALAVAAHVDNCFSHEARVAAQIRALTDPQAVAAFDIAAAWG